MKKLYTFILSAFGIMAAGAQSTLTVHDFKAGEFYMDYGDGNVEPYPVAGVFNHVSSNGKYAVGYDDQNVTSEYGCPFLWRKENPDNLEEISTSPLRISACDVSDEGRIAGSFEIIPEGKDKGYCYPGWKDADANEWHKLPVPEDYSMYQAKMGIFVNEARAITPDGNTIAGNIHITVGEYEFQGSTFERTIEVPVFWKKNSEGEYVIDGCYTELGKAGNNLLYENGKFVDTGKDMPASTFFGRCITPDGKTYAGLNTAGCGGFNPAFVRDGKLYQIYDCGEAYDGFNEKPNFNGGCIYNADANGNLYGFYEHADKTITYFMMSANNRLSILSDASLCADKRGTRYPLEYQGMFPMWDCDDEGTVFVGAGTAVVQELTYNYPICATDDSGLGITKPADNRDCVSMQYADNKIRLSGTYVAANVFNASGKLVRTVGNGSVIDLSAMPAGTYMVKVATPMGIKTFKVAR